MKKVLLTILSLVLACVLMFSLIACEESHEHNYVDGVCSCGDKQNLKEESNNDITAEEWERLFLLGKNYTLVQSIRVEGEEEGFVSQTMKREGDKWLLRDSSERVLYAEIFENKLYEYQNENGKYIKIEMALPVEEIDNFPLNLITYGFGSDDLLNLNNFTKDSVNRVYSAPSIQVLDFYYSNVNISLDESNRLVKMTYEQEGHVFDCIITYGDTVVELPIVE